jgi:hypothetical protein
MVGGLAAIAVPIGLSGVTWWDVGAALVLLPVTAALASAALTWFFSNARQKGETEQGISSLGFVARSCSSP